MKKITPIFILIIVVSSIAFDFFIIGQQGKTESISATIIRWAYDYPSIPFVVGFLCGHLFWKMKDKDVYGEK
jgi:hypothetical protein